MAKIPLIPTDPDLLASLTNYAAGSALSFATRLQANQDLLEARDQEVIAACEQLAAAVGFGSIGGGALSAGSGLSVNAAALTAIVGTWVGFDASQIVGSLTDSSLNYIYLRQDWTWTANTTGVTPLSSDTHGAALLWGTATCSGGGVTAVSNVRRSFLQNLAAIPVLTADPTNAQAGDMWARSDTSEIVVYGVGRFGVGGGGSGNVIDGGVYDPAANYAAHTIVIGGDGLGYISKSSTTGHAPPNVTYWQPIGSVGATGAKGDKGDPGSAGAQGFANKGAWSNATDYVPYDVVTYGGSVYLGLAAGTNQNPVTATSYWQVFLPAGSAGAAGTAGAAGAAGAAIFFQSGAPAGGTGVNGDVGIDTVTGDTYQKASGSWTLQANLRGLQGTTGLQGPSNPKACVITLCEAFTPSGTGADKSALVPFSPVDGTTVLTFAVRRIDFRVDTAGGAPSITIEKSSAAGAFSATTVGTVTMGSGAYEASATSSLGTVQSGNKLRFNVGVVGTAADWYISVLLAEAL